MSNLDKHLRIMHSRKFQKFEIKMTTERHHTRCDNLNNNLRLDMFTF